ASRRPLADVTTELARLGFDVSYLPDDIDTARTDAKILAGRDRKWPIDAQAIAAQTGLPLADVKARVHAYGYTVTAPKPDTDEDRLLQSRNLDQGAPWLTPRQAITSGFLTQAAVLTERHVDDLTAYYQAAGFTVTDERGDDVLLSCERSGKLPYLDHTKPVPLDHVCAVALKLRWSLATTVARLHQLGYDWEQPSSTPPCPGEWGFAQPEDCSWPEGAICAPFVVTTARGGAPGIAEQAADLGWPLVGVVPERLEKLDRKLASVCDIRRALGRATILWLASRFALTPDTAVRRLAQLGFVVVPGQAPLPRRVDKPLAVLLGDHGHVVPPAEHDERLPARFVLAGALKLGIELREATRILTEAGVQFTDPLDILPVERPGHAPRWDEW
ncbi:MAG: hypothetical protein FWE61_09465, partial [Micrococcales bacterium]|nr:hypothetical protein [Micrococcales bacterium]